MNGIGRAERGRNKLLVFILCTNNRCHQRQGTEQLLVLRQERHANTPYARIHFAFGTGVPLLPNAVKLFNTRLAFEHVAELALQNRLTDCGRQMRKQTLRGGTAVQGQTAAFQRSSVVTGGVRSC